MRTFEVPFGRDKLTVNIEDEHFAGALLSKIKDYKPEKSQVELVEEALQNPIASEKLSELAKGKKKIVIISSDHTRPVPSKVIMPSVLKEIRKGNPDADITILISTGLHRSTTKEELVGKFGSEIVENENIVIHDCDDEGNLANIGTLPSGGKLVINRLAAEADLLVTEGFIEPHFFAGFSGGRKSVLPGVAGRETVSYNHNAGFIAHPKTRTGILEGNPIHEDMVFAAKQANVAFIINVIIDSSHDVIKAVAGELCEAHKAGVEFLNSMCRVKRIPADIAISTNGGYPLDQNIYQSVKGMTAAEVTVKDGGVIIMVSKAEDGHGGEVFFDTFKDEKNLEKMVQTMLDRKPEKTIADQWQSQIMARVLMKASVVFVSAADEEVIKTFGMIPARTMDEAMEKAVAIVNKPDYKVTVIPDGVSVIVE